MKRIILIAAIVFAVTVSWASAFGATVKPLPPRGHGRSVKHLGSPLNVKPLPSRCFKLNGSTHCIFGR